VILRDVGAGAAAGGCRVRPNHPLFAGLSDRAWIEAPHPMAASRCGLEDAPRRRSERSLEGANCWCVCARNFVQGRRYRHGRGWAAACHLLRAPPPRCA